MPNEMKSQNFAIVILGIILSLNLIPRCFAESVTKRDLADVLPDANLFIRKTDPFVFYVGYSGEGGYLVGTAFVTTEVVPEESWGYRDQIATLVGVDRKGKITDLKVLSELESPRYTKGFLRDGSSFLTQFKGKDAGDNFVLENDVDAITGATITSSAITRSIQAGLQLVTEEVLYLQVERDNPVKHVFFQHLLWQIDFILLWMTVCLALLSFFKKSEFLHYFTLGLSFAYLGVHMGGGFSTNDVLTLLSRHQPVFLNNLYWYSLVVIAIGLTVIAGRFYCGWLCPFGAFLEILHRVTPIEWTIGESTDKFLKIVKYVNLAIIIGVALMVVNNNLATYLVGIIEPFATFFNLHGDIISWVWLILILVCSAAVSRFYCRYFCPLGAFFAILSGLCSFLKLRQLRVSLPQDNCKGCGLAQKHCQMGAISYNKELKKPLVDGSECFMCNTCAAICPVQSKSL